MALFRLAAAAIALSVLSVPASRAEMPATGGFTATQACPALQSVRKKTNPGSVVIEPGRSYRLVAQNRKKPTHYRIEIPGADPSERWVEAGCGMLDTARAGKPAKAPARGGSFVLAISWQPAFCEGNSRKRECRAQRPDGFDARNFTLHGLWPQPGTNIYCGVSEKDRRAATDGRWADLPRLALTPATQRAVEQGMPGSQSFLDRYEWVKHGTCYPQRDPETYYRDSIRLLEAINQSAVRELLARNIGREVTIREIRARFDEAFGAGAGERVRLACRDDGGRRLIAELTIGLKGDIAGGTPVRDLIAASGPTDPGCPGGVVDAVGLQ